MGATGFMFTIEGENPKDAYDKAVENALYYSGHDSYNGTISTTRGVREFNWAKSKQFPTVESYADHLLMNGTIQKWGSAGCILIKSEKKNVTLTEQKVKKVEQTVPKQTKKEWMTIYVVRDDNGKVYGNYKSKTDAKKFATEKVKIDKISLVIEQQKALKSGNGVELVLKPKVETEKKTIKKTVNTYLMFGWAAC